MCTLHMRLYKVRLYCAAVDIDVYRTGQIHSYMLLHAVADLLLFSKSEFLFQRVCYTHTYVLPNSDSVCVTTACICVRSTCSGHIHPR